MDNRVVLNYRKCSVDAGALLLKELFTLMSSQKAVSWWGVCICKVLTPDVGFSKLWSSPLKYLLLEHYTTSRLNPSLQTLRCFWWLKVKNLPAVQETQETWVRSLGPEDPLEEEMVTHCLENPMDRGAWWATVHGVARSWTHLSIHAPINSCLFNLKIIYSNLFGTRGQFCGRYFSHRPGLREVEMVLWCFQHITFICTSFLLLLH